MLLVFLIIKNCEFGSFRWGGNILLLFEKKIIGFIFCNIVKEFFRFLYKFLKKRFWFFV